MMEFKRDGEKERGEARKTYCEVTDGLAIESKSNWQLPIILKSRLFLSNQLRLASCLFPCCLSVAAQVLLVFRTTSAGLERRTLPS